MTASCAGISVFSTPEGNLAFGAPRANAGGQAPGGGLRDQGERRPPSPHVARSAFDRWRPPDIGLLPPAPLQQQPSQPVRITAGSVELTLRLSDTRAPSWGGDAYVRMDLRARGTDPRPPRDLAVLIDTRDANTLDRAKRLAQELFETLREGDRGALLTTDERGVVRVPLLSYGAVPLLLARTAAITAHGDDDLSRGIERGLQMLTHESERVVRLVVLSGNGGLVTGETIAALELAQSARVEVMLVPLTEAAGHRLEPAANRTHALALAPVAATDAAVRTAINELAALPRAEPLARDLSLVYEATPSPSHLLEVHGGASAWTPSGGEVIFGSVRPGDIRTMVLRVGVPACPTDGNFEPTVRVRWLDAQGPHEVSAALSVPYSRRLPEYLAGRSGDVLHYVSLLGTITAIHRAIEGHDARGLDAMYPTASAQARSLQAYATLHGDRVMGAQSRLLEELLTVARGGRE
ncbi:MAG: hypothetical protein Q8Q09_08185 [Deltaproteobacteria bacterium]|nr:hypothetical protein [Deltaproteobacteria bacterium]